MIVSKPDDPIVVEIAVPSPASVVDLAQVRRSRAFVHRCGVTLKDIVAAATRTGEVRHG